MHSCGAITTAIAVGARYIGLCGSVHMVHGHLPLGNEVVGR